MMTTIAAHRNNDDLIRPICSEICRYKCNKAPEQGGSVRKVKVTTMLEIVQIIHQKISVEENHEDANSSCGNNKVTDYCETKSIMSVARVMLR